MIKTFRELLESVVAPQETQPLSEAHSPVLEWKEVANKLIHTVGPGESIEIAGAGNDYYVLHYKNGESTNIGFKQPRNIHGLMDAKLQAQRYAEKNGLI